MKLRSILTGGVLAIVATTAALAHHATATFYFPDPIEVDGDIQELVWANPHGILVIQDAKGAYWVGEMAAVVDLASQGLSPDKLPKGMKVNLKALPSRDGSNRVHIQSIISDGNEIYTGN